MHKPRLLFLSLPALLVGLAAVPLAAADYYVTATGKATGNGSASSPWDLATALAQPSSVKPGDTIWLRGGTYVGQFTSTLTGAPNKPIVVRQYPRERATIDGNYGGNAATLDIRGSYTWFWGFEVTNSNAARTSPTSDNPAGRGEGVNLFSRGSKLINVVVHDTSQGVLTVGNAPDAEVNGCLVYYNGFDGPDRGHGHAIYVQNETGTKRLVDNILFAQFGYGVHGYTEGGKLDNIYLEGNTSFNNGVLSKVSGRTTNFLIGANGAAATDPTSSGKVAKKTSLVSNASYFSGSGGTAMNLGYSKGIASPTLLDNYLAGGGVALALVNAFRPITMTGNTLYGSLSGFPASEFPSNAFFSSRPTGVKVFIRPNQYEPGRANVTIYNWDRVGSVSLDLRNILPTGTPYELRNAQNFFGPPVLAGTFNGSPLSVPMNGLSPAKPVGLSSAPEPTGPDFQVFVLIPTAVVSNAKPPVASFSAAPASPLAAQTVTFADLTAGTFSSRSWNFGDPGSGAQNTSSLAAPLHSYSAPGTYTVRLSVESDGGVSTRTRDLTVTGSPGTLTATLPVAGHVLGATGSVFVTDVTIGNPTASPVSADLVFSPSGGASPLHAALSLGAGEIRLLKDVVASEFGVDDAFGSLRVDTEGTPPASLRLASRTYVEEAGGTLGLGAVGLTPGDSTTGDLYLSNLAVSDTFRTNVGALNTTDETQVFSLHLFDGNGNIVGRSGLVLEPGSQQQWGLAQLFPGVTGTGLTARISPTVGGLAPLAYAAVTDNASSDPTYYPALGAAPVLYVPGIAGVTGVGGAFFRSEISIANSGHGPATVTLTFLEHDRDNTVAPTSRLVLAPGETLHADDALQTLFGISETYGALKVESDVAPGVSVFERILTDATTTSGTVGQQMETISAENLFPRGAVLGLRQDSEFRSNIGILNPNAGGLAVSLTLLGSLGAVLGTTSVFLPPRAYVQRNLATLFPAVDLHEEILSIAFDAGTLPVIAFASVIDNVSQDPTFYPGRP